MNTIAGIQKASSTLGKFEFSEFRIIRELHFSANACEGGASCNVDLVVESEDRTPNYQIKISFSGVSGLKCQGFGGGETRVAGLDVMDISGRQWEGLHWELVDFENDTLEFCAATAEIISVTPVSR
jgi:hypothetical protein